MIKIKLWSCIQVLLFLTGMLVLWQIATFIFKIPTYILPSPLKVLETLLIQREYLISNSITTIIEILLGFFIGSLFGFVLALLIVSSKPLEKVLYPILIFNQITPKLAVAPLFLIWFGYGLLPKIIVTALMSFFPIVVNTVKGMKNVHPDFIDLMHSLSATKKQILYTIRLPNSVPFLFSALKLSITASVIGAVIGEFIGSNKGLGYVITLANTNLDTEVVFASLLILCIIGSILFLFIEFTERTLFKNYSY